MANGFIGFEFNDLDDWLKSLKQLKPVTQRKVARRGAVMGARHLRDEIRKAARRFDNPATKESVHKNINIQSAPRLAKSQGGGAAYRVGVRGGARTREENQKNPGGDTFYWRYREFGTRHQKAEPFIRPTLAEQKETAMSIAFRAALEQLKIEIRKLGG